MKAKYILEALEAMKEADRLSYSMDPEEFGRIIARLQLAAFDLRRHGIAEVEIQIDKESA